MSNREDYLDSLLKSVEVPGEETTDSISSPVPGPEDDFLKDFDQQLMDLDEDDFLKEFEMGLDGEDGQVQSRQPSQAGSNENDLDGLGLGDEMEPDSLSEEDYFGLDDQEAQSENGGQVSFDEDGMMINTMDQGDLEQMGKDPFGDEENMSDGDDLEAMLNAAMATADEKISAKKQEEAEAQTIAPGEDADVMELLSGLGADEDLSDIGDMLKEQDQQETLPDEDLSGMAKELAEEMDQLGFDTGLGVDDAGETDISAEGEAEEALPEKKKKRGKKDKAAKKNPKESGEEKEGIFKKLSRIIFGEDEEDDVKKDALSDAQEIENLSPENLEVMRQLDKEGAGKEKALSKKEEKERKKKEKQEKKAQKQKEKKEKPPKEKKPKKEKKEKEPKEKSKPLPKGPVILIFVMAVSIIVLVNLSSSLLGYTSSLEEAKNSFGQGNYEEAYAVLRGMKIKEKDEALFDKARLASYIQKQWNSYEAFLGKGMYPEALNALVLGVGRYDKYLEEANNAGVGAEYESMLSRIQDALMNQFGVSVEEARTVFGQNDRESFTLELYTLLRRAGLAE